MRIAMAGLMLFSAAAALAGDASFEEKTLTQELGALQKGSYADFVAPGDAQFKAMPEAEFKKAADMFSGKLKAGYKSTYLGVLKEQNGIRVHYWRLEFPSESHDWLAKMAVKDGRVAGFFITRP